MKLAKVVVKLRKKTKLTCHTLAREAKVDPTYLGRLERGERRHPCKEIVLNLTSETYKHFQYRTFSFRMRDVVSQPKISPGTGIEAVYILMRAKATSRSSKVSWAR